MNAAPPSASSTPAIALTTAELEAGLAEIRRAPTDAGVIALIVRRPAVDEREVLAEGRLEVADGLVGDNWRARGSRSTPDRTADPQMQINVMSARAAAVISPRPERWPLAGDQLFVDLDLSVENLPPGTRLALGEAVIEVTPAPHTGCAKFAARFGRDALAFVNSPVGKQLRLRGLNARVIQSGTIRAGDRVRKMGGIHVDRVVPNALGLRGES